MLRKALDVFWERCYEGASMSDLTNAMGIASASIYACFGSKEALFRETVALYGTTAGEPPMRALREQSTARGRPRRHRPLLHHRGTGPVPAGRDGASRADLEASSAARWLPGAGWRRRKAKPELRPSGGDLRA
ncbi:TetR/AcrR family transcriptional regulator [Nonomuraea basaltis]|nr:TetR/AcrR family transcriptional regulator [Nonomuraea basaltis]